MSAIAESLINHCEIPKFADWGRITANPEGTRFSTFGLLPNWRQTFRNLVNEWFGLLSPFEFPPSPVLRKNNKAYLPIEVEPTRDPVSSALRLK
jgi:hypothetical protein